MVIVLNVEPDNADIYGFVLLITKTRHCLYPCCAILPRLCCDNHIKEQLFRLSTVQGNMTCGSHALDFPYLSIASKVCPVSTYLCPYNLVPLLREYFIKHHPFRYSITNGNIVTCIIMLPSTLTLNLQLSFLQRDHVRYLSHLRGEPAFVW